MVAVVVRADAAAQGGRPLHRPLPVPRGAHAELLGEPGRQALLLLRLRQGRRHDHVRPRDRGPRLRRRDRVARPSASASSSSTSESSAARTRERRRRAPAPRVARARRRRSTSATSGTRRRARSRATTSPGAASARRSAASSGSGSRSAERRSRARRVEKGFTRGGARARPGSTRQRGGDYFQRRLVFPLADARGRVVGFQARRLHEDDPLQAKYVNSPEGELFHKGSVAVRPRHGARGDREGRTAPASSRGTPT